MDLGLGQYLERLAAVTIDNRERLDQSMYQRRDQTTDLHGVEYTRQAGPGAPAVFFVSISRDMIYLSRFEFKLLIAPYTQLSPSSDPVIVPVSQSGFRVAVDGVDVSAYLAAQHNGWIGGEGVYPSLDVDKNYDLLEASSDMRAEGNVDLAEKIVSPGYKRIQVSGTSLFTCTLQLTCKFSHVNT